MGLKFVTEFIPLFAVTSDFQLKFKSSTSTRSKKKSWFELGEFVGEILFDLQMPS